jgi:benzaldehyde dehydrogenase (NAD)
VRKAKVLVAGDPFDEKVQVGPIVNERQAANVERIVAETIAKGAKLMTGGSRKGLFFQPTVITGVTPGMAAFDEERFGPVAVITTFRNDEEAIALANATDYGLVAARASASHSSVTSSASPALFAVRTYDRACLRMVEATSHAPASSSTTRIFRFSKTACPPLR